MSLNPVTQNDQVLSHMHMQHHEFSIDSITFWFLQCPGVLALICFCCWNTNYSQSMINSTHKLKSMQQWKIYWYKIL